MSDLKINSLNSMLNLGSLNFMLTVYLTKILIFLTMRLIFVRSCGLFKETVDGQLKNAFYNEIIILSTESSLDIFVAGYLQSLKKEISWDYFGETFSFILGIICFVIVTFIPIVYAHIMRQRQEVINSPEF